MLDLATLAELTYLGTCIINLSPGRLDANGGQQGGQRVHYISCTFGMMPAAFGPVIPATSRVTVMLVYAEETSSDFAREVPEGT